ncbi:MAG: alkaline phosphatase family protein [Acidobacteriota bacterium]
MSIKKKFLIFGAIAVVLLFAIIDSIFFIPSGQTGNVYSRLTRSHPSSTYGEGLHFKIPFFHGVRKVPAETVDTQAIIEHGLIPPTALSDLEIYKQVEEKRKDTKLRLFLIGWDAADWFIIDPMLEKGKLPNLNALIKNGFRANLKSTQPMLSPLLWTTIATGKMPDKHGINDFLVIDTASGRKVPISSAFRKSKALWNIFSDFNLRNAFVAWWATWPAEIIDGYMVTERLSYSLFNIKKEELSRPGLVYPPSYLGEIKGFLIGEGDVTFHDIGRFLHMDEGEFQSIMSSSGTDEQAEFKTQLQHLTKIYSKTMNYHRIALDLLEREPFKFFSVYYEAIDEVGHRFQHYMEPKMEMVARESFEKFKDVVPEYYRFQDELLGEILTKADKDTVIMILSDHGFKSGTGRPRDEPPFVEGKPGLWHRMYGIFVLSGPNVRRGQADVVDIYDVAPTVLYILGLPQAEDMEGRIVKQAFEDSFLASHAPARVKTYESASFKPQAVEGVDSAMGSDDEFIANLKALGYIAAGDVEEASQSRPPGQSTASRKSSGVKEEGFEKSETYHVNLAGTYLKNKEYQKAEEEIQKAIKKNPRYTPAYTLLANIYRESKREDEAIKVYEKIYSDSRGEREGILITLMDLYLKKRKMDEAAGFASRVRDEFAEKSVSFTCEAMLEEEMNSIQEASALYLRALSIDPTFVEAMVRLYGILHKHGDITQLESLLRKGLSMNENLGLYHNWLGAVLIKKQAYNEAYQELLLARKMVPEAAAPLVNMGILHSKRDQPDEAIRILKEALSKEPEYPEAWLELGINYGKKKKFQEAFDAFEKSRRFGGSEDLITFAEIVTHVQKGDYRTAISRGEESLKRNPNQPKLRSFLNEIKE